MTTTGSISEQKTQDKEATNQALRNSTRLMILEFNVSRPLDSIHEGHFSRRTAWKLSGPRRESCSLSLSKTITLYVLYASATHPRSQAVHLDHDHSTCSSQIPVGVHCSHLASTVAVVVVDVVLGTPQVRPSSDANKLSRQTLEREPTDEWPLSRLAAKSSGNEAINS